MKQTTTTKTDKMIFSYIIGPDKLQKEITQITLLLFFFISSTLNGHQKIINSNQSETGTSNAPNQERSRENGLILFCPD